MVQVNDPRFIVTGQEYIEIDGMLWIILEYLEPIEGDKP